MASSREVVILRYRSTNSCRIESPLDAERDRTDFQVLMKGLVMPTRPLVQ
jgi:hypothetical protein